MNEPEPLSPDDIERVRTSFDRFWSASSGTAELFYHRLFEIAPEVRSLFHSDLGEQQRKFIGTLATIVGNLDNAVAFSAAATLAKHHVAYGVQPVHYAPVGEALLWSLKETLGDRWTPDVAASWSKAYALISDHMVRAANR